MDMRKINSTMDESGRDPKKTHRMIEARLAESAEDLKNGRTFGPFNTADEMIASMKKQLKTRAACKASKTQLAAIRKRSSRN